MDNADFMSKYEQIIKLITDPKSFVKEEEPKEFKDPLENITKTIESLVAQHTDEKVMLAAVCDVLNKDMGELKLTPDVLEFMIKVCSIPTACAKFQTSKLFDEHKNDQVEPTMLMVVQCMTCQTCGKLGSQHQGCSLYQEPAKDTSSLFDDACCTCGLSKYEHKVCSQYKYGPNDVTEDKCTECHLSHTTHLQELEKLGKQACFNFKNDGHNYCVDCLIDKTSHCYSALFRKLNKNTQSEITLMSLQMQIMCMNNPIYMSSMKTLNDLLYVDNYIEIFKTS
jgi:hypothetical protein